LLRDQRRGWDHLEVLLSLVYRLLRCLFGLLAVLVRSDLSKDVELLVLRHENQALRRQAGGRPRWDHTDRLWLTALSQQVNRRRWSDIFPVTRPRSCAGTVTSSLHTAGIDPAPRRAGPSWRQFLAAQAHAILACDFLVV
jgi:putative transposase